MTKKEECRMRHMPWRCVLCLVLVTTSVTLAQPAPAKAWDGFRDYTYSSSNCGSTADYKDPLNYFFNTTNHGLGEEPVARGYIAGWPVYWGETPIGSNQYMWSSNGGCHIQDHQQAQGITGFGKYHTRLRQGPWITGYGYATAAPMHHDTLVWCGFPPLPQDAADSFNSARNEAKTKFSDAGFSQTRYWVGNTQWMTQCDGNRVQNDGYVWENHGY
jgi:hypothetical protein